MPQWVLRCPCCNHDFAHCAIEVSGTVPAIEWGGTKPDAADGWASVECPNCKKLAVYGRNQLVYRTT